MKALDNVVTGKEESLMLMTAVANGIWEGVRVYACQSGFEPGV